MFYRKFGKRIFDIIASSLGLILLSPLILLGWILASLSTFSNGIFTQQRVGANGKLFNVYKLKTMSDAKSNVSSVTALNTKRITKVGKQLRKFKLDELPQLVNVLLGDMSFVGPRPDVPGYADTLNGELSLVAEALPGITGYATLYFKNEEDILSDSKSPQDFNDNIIYPLKSHLNLRYLKEYTFFSDMKIIIQTVTSKDCLSIVPLRNQQDCIALFEEISC
ncbi:sugar transferase [Vibrio coralliirubri]|uniref:sugar transferase n=1 Tax=Vibrio coralliirubri TaxID=1516159 RepID=UPI0006348722|nr:sugar transferase [Vibrio coralliirubri]CDT49766.1 Undecaprenyl-phosphate galactose phosphotransferase [Vibrio coralliirubri]